MSTSWKQYRKMSRTSNKRPTSKPALVKLIKSTISKAAEHKWGVVGNLLGDFPSIPSATYTSWMEKDCTSLVQGSDSIGNRIGRKIRLTGFHLDGVMMGGQVNGASDDAFNYVRLIVALNEEAVSLNGATDSRFPITKNYNSSGLIKKLVDKTIMLNVQGKNSTGYIPAGKHVVIHKKLNEVINYEGTGAGTADKHLVLSLQSDSILVPSPGFVTGYYYITFEDI